MREIFNKLAGTEPPTTPTPCESMKNKINALANKLTKCKSNNCLANKKSNLSKKEKYALGEGNIDTVNLALKNLKDYKKALFKAEEELNNISGKIKQKQREKKDCIPYPACSDSLEIQIKALELKELSLKSDITAFNTSIKNSSKNLSNFLDGITCNT